MISFSQLAKFVSTHGRDFLRQRNNQRLPQQAASPGGTGLLGLLLFSVMNRMIPTATPLPPPVTGQAPANFTVELVC